MSEEEKANGENAEGKVSNWENWEDAILTEKFEMMKKPTSNMHDEE